MSTVAAPMSCPVSPTQGPPPGPPVPPPRSVTTPLSGRAGSVEAGQVRGKGAATPETVGTPDHETARERLRADPDHDDPSADGAAPHGPVRLCAVPDGRCGQSLQRSRGARSPGIGRGRDGAGRALQLEAIAQRPGRGFRNPGSGRHAGPPDP